VAVMQSMSRLHGLVVKVSSTTETTGDGDRQRLESEEHLFSVFYV